ncbi:Uncharacterised protein [Klebsiella pneumoniae]|uniref:Uncharacterized protein n=1 Tax=Klebsiella pneumoniae TaxID=573 RepID=A0A2X3HLW4_KLEPN|nr:Uncharacterised protein [Klebsiella pneumoniae]
MAHFLVTSAARASIIGKENEPVTVVAVLYQNINTIMGQGVRDVSQFPRTFLR